jgi:hypothetical protein
MALFHSRSMPAPRPAMINAGYTDTTHVWLVIGHTPWKMVYTLGSNQSGRVHVAPWLRNQKSLAIQPKDLTWLTNVTRQDSEPLRSVYALFISNWLNSALQYPKLRKCWMSGW